MAKLPKFTLSKNKNTQRWDLAQDKSHQVVKSFATKDKATAGGVLSKALGADGGSVKIKKTDGEFQEERTFPRSADPRTSKG
jgi:hypothetical protein